MASTKLVGIINVTPDSFSDGNRHFSPRDALAAIAKMAGDGADVIDIGAESTRPGATPLSYEEEWARLEPVLSELSSLSLPWSVDTRHAATAQKALDLGAYWINDVSGFSDPAMIEAVKPYGCKLVVMHSLSVPADKAKILPADADVVAEVLVWAHTRIGYMTTQGIAKDRLIFDPGIGFGKTGPQSWHILESIDRFKELAVPILIGHSRKSFLANSEMNRDVATLEASRDLIIRQADYLRVHDVPAHRRLIASMHKETADGR
jgi:dihydropteroate synthase